MKGRQRAWLALAAAGVGGLLLFGCGTKAVPEKVAFVNFSSEQEDEKDLAIWEGVSAYATASDGEAILVTAASADDADIEKAIDRAIEEGAGTIVCYGQRMGQAIYDMQRVERSTQFLYIDGVPTDTASGSERIRTNTTCIAPAKEQAGFLAGYAAVSEGYSDLLVLGGAQNVSSILQASGFVQGAEQAARDAGTNVEKITVHVQYLGGDKIAPGLLTELEDRFESGCQLIYALDDGPAYLAASAAAATNGKVILAADAGEAPTDAVLALTDIDYSQVAQRALERFAAGELAGGETVIFNAGDGGAALHMETAQFRYFTQEIYDSLVRRIADGRLQVLTTDVIRTPPDDYTLQKVEVDLEEAA